MCYAVSIMLSVAEVAMSQLWDASPMAELYHMADSALAWNEEDPLK